MTNRDIFVFESKYKLTDYLVSVWQDCAKTEVQKKQQFNAALAGGRTPVEFYCKLSNIDNFELWRYTEIFLTDERCVAPDHQESNVRMVKENLIDYVFMESDQFHPVCIEDGDPVRAAENYERDLMDHFSLDCDQIPQFDLVLLGMGEDGHIASLFSDRDLIRGRDRLVVPTEPIHLQHKRVSLTMPVLNNAKRIICIVTGKSKADILYRIIEQEENCPALRLSPKNGQLIFMADRFAAQKLMSDEEFDNQKEIISLKK